jgi:hypothetical protein
MEQKDRPSESSCHPTEGGHDLESGRPNPKSGKHDLKRTKPRIIERVWHEHRARTWRNEEQRFVEAEETIAMLKFRKVSSDRYPSAV